MDKLTEEELKIYHLEYMKRYRQKNKENIKKYNKEYNNKRTLKRTRKVSPMDKEIKRTRNDKEELDIY